LESRDKPEIVKKKIDVVKWSTHFRQTGGMRPVMGQTAKQEERRDIKPPFPHGINALTEQ
jgi:hypothetical protein